MAAFTYTARDVAGIQKTGTVEAGDAVEARQLLRRRELFVVSLQQMAATRRAKAQRRGKVGLGDMVVMSRQLSTLVKAGLPIIECLDAVSGQTDNATLVDALKNVRVEVLSGSTMTDAMRKHPAIFPEKYISLVNAGEMGGMLDLTLEVAAEQFDQEATLREQVKAAFVYPVIVVVTMVLVVIFMLVFIVPVFSNVYEQFHAELPLVTQMLVMLSYMVLHYWWMVLIGMGVFAFLWKRWIKTPRGERIYHIILFKLPLLGKLNRKIAVSRFTNSFAGMTKAGVPLLRALAVSAQTASNRLIIEAIDKVIHQVKEGATLSGPIEQTNEFPPMVTRMISAGERSGNLDEMLEQITHFYRRDIEYTVAKLTRILEPAMTVVVGGVVLFVLLALYMPVFNLSKVIQAK